MDLWLLRIAIIVYLIATASQLAFLVTLKAEVRKFASWVTWGAFALHTVLLLTRLFAGGYAPMATLHEAYSFFGWCTLGLYLVLLLRYSIPSLGAFATPLALILLLGAAVTPSDIIELPPALQSGWLPIHVGLLFIGNAAFGIAAVSGIMYLIQERQLKKKKLGMLFHRLPNIEVLDEIGYRCLTIGFPFLTLGIITGAAWAQEAWGTYWSWDPKETWSLITWFIYAALLHGRMTVGWRGRKAALWAIGGFACVLFTFLGVNYVLPLILPNVQSLHIYG
ncbi:MAG: c-type cytochrome biogenesis protein CcsB [Deltaproteobacteria bacterium]|nr:MAG: c-type cytochrome biogenesis protein CcsB [Deltaproteobacteria bacterium]